MPATNQVIRDIVVTDLWQELSRYLKREGYDVSLPLKQSSGLWEEVVVDWLLEAQKFPSCVLRQ